jgi:hypothetical protein
MTVSGANTASHESKKNAQKMPIPVEVPMLCHISGHTVVEALVNSRCARTALLECWPLARAPAQREVSPSSNGRARMPPRTEY